MNRIGNIKYNIILLLLLCSCCNKPDPDIPMVPADVYAGDYQNGFGVYWTDEGENALGFKIFRSVNSQDDFINYADVPFAAQLYFIDRNVSDSNYYTYQVSAYNSFGESAVSKTALVPKAPQNPKAETMEKSILISWEIKAQSQAMGFVVERSIDDTINFQEIKNQDLSNNFYTDEGASQGNEYYYRIRSYAEQFTSQPGLSLPSSTYGPIRANSGESGSFKDDRDGKEYKYIEIGQQVWMAENLNFETSKGSWCFQKTTTNCNSYGRLYDWGTANTDFGNGLDICPTGWHLPSDSEWKQLERQLGMPEEDIEKDRYRKGGEIGRKLKTGEGWSNTTGDNSSGFSARPAGFREMFGGYKDLGVRTSWWTATKVNVVGAYRRWITPSTGIGRYSSYQTFGFSVRCLKN